MLTLVVGLQAKTYVVCVGIADYPGKSHDLQSSSADAATIQNIYDKNGKAQTVLCLNTEATIQQVCNLMEQTFSSATESDVITFYFSGHGVPGGFVFYDGILFYQAIVNIMKGSRAATRIVMADTCFSGDLRSSKEHTGKHTDTDVMFFLSSRDNEQSLEIKGWKNGLFTTYLARGLRGGADTNHDRIITAKELFTFVHEGVISKSRKRQHPVMWGNFSDNMSVIKW